MTDLFVASFVSQQRLRIARRYLAISWRLILIDPVTKKPFHAAHKEIRGTSSWGVFARTFQQGERAWSGEPTRKATKREAEGSGVLTEADIVAALRLFPTTCFAVLTGNGLAVIDIDHPDAFPYELANDLQGQTPTVKTGRGTHFYCAAAPMTRMRTNQPFGDLKADGGYAVLPPFSDGREWLVDPECELQPLPPSVQALALAPPLDHSQTQAKRVKPVSGLGLRSSQWNVRGEAEPKLPPEQALLALDVIVGRSGYALTRGGKLNVVCPIHRSGGGGAATLLVAKSGDWVFHCIRCGLSLGLAKFYARTRGQTEINGPSAARSWTRLLAEIGQIELPPVEAPVPLGNAYARKVADGFLLLLRCRLYGAQPKDLPGVPFAPSFGAPWCGVPAGTFQWRKGELIQSGWLIRTEKSSGRKQPSLWLPRGFNSEGAE